MIDSPGLIAASPGLILGIIGLLGFFAGLMWLAGNLGRDLPARAPAVLSAISLVLCAAGYFLTPTGAANLQMWMDRLLG